MANLINDYNYQPSIEDNARIVLGQTNATPEEQQYAYINMMNQYQNLPEAQRNAIGSVATDMQNRMMGNQGIQSGTAQPDSSTFGSGQGYEMPQNLQSGIQSGVHTLIGAPISQNNQATFNDPAWGHGEGYEPQGNGSNVMQGLQSGITPDPNNQVSNRLLAVDQNGNIVNNGATQGDIMGGMMQGNAEGNAEGFPEANQKPKIGWQGWKAQGFPEMLGNQAQVQGGRMSNKDNMTSMNGQRWSRARENEDYNNSLY